MNSLTTISKECAVPIALTSDQQDLAEAVAGFTARHAAITATRAAFDKIAAGQPQPSWQALADQGLHAIHLPEWAGGDGAGLVELAVSTKALRAVCETSTSTTDAPPESTSAFVNFCLPMAPSMGVSASRR